jgi:hypothetical protein
VLVASGDLDQQLAINQQIRLKALASAGQLERPATQSVKRSPPFRPDYELAWMKYTSKPR